MLGTLVRYTRQVRRPALAAIAVSALMLPTLTAPASARGPDGIADVAERVIDAVVNISTSQNVASRNQGGGGGGAMPNLPNDPQLDELFRDFFNRRGQGDNQNRGNNTPRRVNSLGSGFIIDSAGIVVTNNHVIADADEITVILNDGSRIKAERKGSEDRPRALARQDRQAAEVGQIWQFRQSAARRMGDRDRQPVQPWRHGDRRYRVGAQSRHQLGPLRQLHSD